MMSRFLIGACIGALIAIACINWSLKPSGVQYDAIRLVSFQEAQLILSPITWPILTLSTDVMSVGWHSDCELTGMPINKDDVNKYRIAIVALMSIYIGCLAFIRGKSKNELLWVTGLSLVMAGIAFLMGLKFVWLYLLFSLFNGTVLYYYLFLLGKLKKSRIFFVIMVPMLVYAVDFIVIGALMLDYQC